MALADLFSDQYIFGKLTFHRKTNSYSICPGSQLSYTRARASNFTIMPERSVKVRANDCPWITKDLKRLILQKQKAFTAGKMSLFKLSRNKVNRKWKGCRKFYQ